MVIAAFTSKNALRLSANEHRAPTKVETPLHSPGDEAAQEHRQGSAGTQVGDSLVLDVAKPRLNRFCIGPDANEEGCEAVTEIIKAESP